MANMETFDRRALKKSGEELQQYMHFRRRGAVVESKKNNKKYIRKQNKAMCRNADY